MAASKIAITIDDNTLKRLDILVKSKIFSKPQQSYPGGCYRKINAH
jgi:hypothetical protein